MLKAHLMCFCYRFLGLCVDHVPFCFLFTVWPWRINIVQSKAIRNFLTSTNLQTTQKQIPTMCFPSKSYFSCTYQLLHFKHSIALPHTISDLKKYHFFVSHYNKRLFFIINSYFIILKLFTVIIVLIISLPLVDVKSPTHSLPLTPRVTVVCGITYYGWSDNGPIAGDLISPLNTR